MYKGNCAKLRRNTQDKILTGQTGLALVSCSSVQQLASFNEKLLITLILICAATMHS